MPSKWEQMADLPYWRLFWRSHSRAGLAAPKEHAAANTVAIDATGIFILRMLISKWIVDRMWSEGIMGPCLTVNLVWRLFVINSWKCENQIHDSLSSDDVEWRISASHTPCMFFTVKNQGGIRNVNNEVICPGWRWICPIVGTKRNRTSDISEQKTMRLMHGVQALLFLWILQIRAVQAVPIVISVTSHKNKRFLHSIFSLRENQIHDSLSGQEMMSNDAEPRRNPDWWKRNLRPARRLICPILGTHRNRTSDISDRKAMSVMYDAHALRYLLRFFEGIGIRFHSPLPRGKKKCFLHIIYRGIETLTIM